MAKLRVRNGAVIVVPNKNPVFGANSKYVSIWVEDQNGRNERAIFLTEHEFKTAPRIILWDDDKMVSGRLYPVKIRGRAMWAVRVHTSSSSYVLTLTPKRLKYFEERASKNPEDIPKKSFLMDLLD